MNKWKTRISEKISNLFETSLNCDTQRETSLSWCELETNRIEIISCISAQNTADT